MNKEEFNCRLVSWEDVRDDVRKINEEFADIIDKIQPNKRYPLVKAGYKFGDLIVNDGVTSLPLDGELVPLSEYNVHKNIKEGLSYSTIPLFLTLKNANEVFVNSASRAVPLNIFYPGSFLGLFESLDYMFGREGLARWSVSAGARNIFTLPKINELLGFRRLKIAFDLSSDDQPRYLSDHWRVFRKISQHKNFEQNWKNEILFFTKNWLSNHNTDKEWAAFRNYLFKMAWHQAQFAISKLGLNITWEHFVNAISARNLKPIPYIVDQVKHIMLMAAGRWPGFRTADLTDQVAPIRGLQKVITEIYMLKKHIPTMMHVSSLEQDIHVPLYYSLSYPTLLEGASQNKTASTIMLDMREIKQLIDTIKPTFSNARIEDSNLEGINFEYFHVELDKYNEIKQSKEIIHLDDTFLADIKRFPEREFCTTSQFWRGCITISKE